MMIITAACAQETELPRERHVALNGTLSETYNEFSGLAKWQDKIVLIPQYRQKFKENNKIFAIDTSSIAAVLENVTDNRLKITELTITNIDAIVNSVNSINKNDHSFDGFEGAVVIGNTIYLTIETDDTFCFIVKGGITKIANTNKATISLQPPFPVKKPDNKYTNAGFESIAYLPSQNKLVIFFENNMLHKPTAFLIDTSLTTTTDIVFQSPLLFRLTDVAFVKTVNGRDSLVGINHFYNDFKSYTHGSSEFNYYLTGDTTQLFSQQSLDFASKEMHNRPLLTTSYTRLVGITIENNKAYWKEEKVISYSDDNWEGIATFRDGVLMVVDGMPPSTPCKLSYFITN